jgi:hypothetical protein
MMASATRIMLLSMAPPAKPAIPPYKSPIGKAISNPRKPIVKLFWAPKNSRE